MRRKSKEKGAAQAQEKCLRLLARRAHSSAELQQKLRASGFAEEPIACALTELRERGLLDDEDFARSWVAERKLAGGFGRRKLAWELQRKGIARPLIAQILAEELEEETELKQAQALAEKKMQGKALEPTELMRLRRFLLGRGYGFEVVDKVLQSLPLPIDAEERLSISRETGETSW